MMSWGLRFRMRGNFVRGSISPGIHIPDSPEDGVSSIISLMEDGQVRDIKVSVDISHTYVNDLTVKLRSPANTEIYLHNKTGGDSDNIRIEYTSDVYPQLFDFVEENVNGGWCLVVTDHAGLDTGKLNHWEIEVKVG